MLSVDCSAAAPPPPVIDIPASQQFDERPSLVIPMVYDVNANITQLAERRDSTGTITSSATNSASQLLRRFAEQHKANAAVSGECTIFPAVRELLTNYVMPMEGDATAAASASAATATATTTLASAVTVNSSGNSGSGVGSSITITLSGAGGGGGGETSTTATAAMTTTISLATTAPAPAAATAAAATTVNMIGQQHHGNSVILTTEPIQKPAVSAFGCTIFEICI